MYVGGLGHPLCSKTVVPVWHRWIPLLLFLTICLLWTRCLHCCPQRNDFSALDVSGQQRLDLRSWPSCVIYGGVVSFLSHFHIHLTFFNTVKLALALLLAWLRNPCLACVAAWGVWSGQNLSKNQRQTTPQRQSHTYTHTHTQNLDEGAEASA